MAAVVDERIYGNGAGSDEEEEDDDAHADGCLGEFALAFRPAIKRRASRLVVFILSLAFADTVVRVDGDGDQGGEPEDCEESV